MHGKAHASTAFSSSFSLACSGQEGCTSLCRGATPVSMCQTLFGEGEESQTQWYAEGKTTCKQGSSLLLTYSEQDQVLSGEDLAKEQLC